MQRVMLILVLFISFSFADSVLLLKKGWQLIGSTMKIENMSIFESKDVEQVWHFDAGTQKWKGYSPDSSIQKRMSDKGYAKISSLESWHGFWVKSRDEWALTFATDATTSDENITLQKGWNLISLPVNTVVSPHLFDDKAVWKYSRDDQWEFFEKQTKEDFPAISHITNSDGIWVKSDQKQTISVSSDSAKLHNFEDEDEMKSYIKDMLLTNDRPICGYYPMLRGVASDGVIYANQKGAIEDGVFQNSDMESPKSADDTSGTNLQEKGVDESDIVKHDGTTIFYVSKNPNSYDEMYVNITTFENIANNNLKPIDKITINGLVDSLYLVDGKLVVLSRYGFNNHKPQNTTSDEKTAIRYGGDISSMIVDIYEVSDLSNIQKSASYKINGQLNNSRVVGGKLFLITSFSPHVQKDYPKIYVDAPECKEFFNPYVDEVDGGGGGGISVPSNPKPKPQRVSRDSYTDYKKYARCYNILVDKDGKYFRYDYDNPTITYERLIPFVQKNGDNERALITPKTFFAPDKKDQDATITTVSKIDISTATLEKTSSVLGYSSTVYASSKALYLVSNKYPMFYNFDRYKERSAVYKFLLDDNLSYKASGFVNGSVLNQFSLSEYNDILRIATTEGNSWNATLNSLYTLIQQDDLMLIHGALSGLGKERETIRSVRFVGKRAYVVTYEIKDPFYTIDLSDAANPTKAGELEIYGYSSYLHPIDETHILGIGRDATPDGQVMGLKMELFNVGDFTTPTSVATHSFGSQYSYSEMEQNHKALAYRDSDKLLGFAYSTRNYTKDAINQLGIFQIVGNSIKAYAPIVSPNSSSYYNSFERGLIFDFAGQTYVAYFANGEIAYTILNSLN